MDPFEGREFLEAVDRVAEVEAETSFTRAGSGLSSRPSNVFDRERRRKACPRRGRLRLLTKDQGQLGRAALREVDAVQLAETWAPSIPGGNHTHVVRHEALAAMQPSAWLDEAGACVAAPPIEAALTWVSCRTVPSAVGR